MDNNSQQADELEVLASIYGDDWQFNERIGYSIEVTPNVKLYITLNSEYPSHKPPNYDLLAPLLSRHAKQKIKDEFTAIFNNNNGYPILFQWIEKLKELVKNNEFHNDKLIENFDTCYLSRNKVRKHASRRQPLPQIIHCEITHGETIKDRKSVFQGHCARVNSVEGVREVINILLQNKKIAHASHNISAYRIKLPSGTILQDCDDDGENHAGGRLMHLLEILNSTNVLVVVSRWYGGIHLGPDRFKHINNAARQALVQGGLVH